VSAKPTPIKPISEFRWTIMQYPSTILVSHAKELGRFMRNAKIRSQSAQYKGRREDFIRHEWQVYKLRRMLREIQAELRCRKDWS